MSKRNVFSIIILLIIVPLTVYFGALVFKDKHYLWLSLCVALLSCSPLFFIFERKEASSAELSVIAVLVAISVLGRFAFAWIPGFKPVTAITVISAIWLGKEAGFAIGALSAVISNFYFGQGPWTPFQMLSWGLIGFFAGLLFKALQKNRILVCVFGGLSGVAYSLTMDVWTTVWVDNTFNLSRYLASVAIAFPTTVAYAISNVVFIWFLAKPIGNKLSRIKKKYGLFV